MACRPGDQLLGYECYDPEVGCCKCHSLRIEGIIRTHEKRHMDLLDTWHSQGGSSCLSTFSLSIFLVQGP